MTMRSIVYVFSLPPSQVGGATVVTYVFLSVCL